MEFILDRSQRHTAYCILLAEIESTGDCNSICHLSGDLFGIYPCLDGYRWQDCPYEIVVKTSQFYPELWKQRTQDGGYWWRWDEEGTRKRIEALKKCIEETA